MPPSLLELQRHFAAAIFEPQATLEEICAGEFSATERLQIYQRNTTITLSEALASCYPVVRSLVGEEFFAAVAEQYLRSHPPRTGNLHDFGADLPAFLRDFAPAQALGYLPDVARLEWARQLSYHALDAPTLEVETLRGISPVDYADLLFELHPATRLVASAHPVFDIWQMHQTPADSQAGVDLRVGAQQVRVFRHRLKVQLESLRSDEYLWLQALAARRTLGEATEIATSADTSFDLGQALQWHIAGGTWTAITPPHLRKQ